MVAHDVRKQAFAAFVRRAAHAAQLNRGWSLPRIAKEAGIGTNTLYRWTKGDWTNSPEAQLVEKFCNTLDIPVDAAFQILWPGGDDRPVDVAPLPTDPDFEILLRRLNDPKVPDEEKFLIRETIRGLVARAVPPARKAAG
jgi:transcriptional regulator with XRE-family HTH domain